MYSDGSSFLKRALVFQAELKKQNYPNAKSLAGLCGCSEKTAGRTVTRLRYEFSMPIEYDEVRHGYYLLDPNYELPDIGLGKDELAALLLTRNIAQIVGARDLEEKIDLLWLQHAAQFKALSGELEHFSEFFSSDLTSVSILADLGLLELVESAANGSVVRLSYHSPWSAEGDKLHEGHIEHVRFCDGALYVLFHSDKDRKMVLNAAFIKNFEVLGPGKHPIATPAERETWEESFGVFSTKAEEIEISILPPASHYYASQSWHEDQKDRWEGEVLIRRLLSPLSPEIVRRIISLGSFVHDVRPAVLKEMVLAEAVGLLKNLSRTLDGD